MSQTILLTSATEDSEEILDHLDNPDVLHTPLEVYSLKTHQPEFSNVLGGLGKFENIVHSNIRNARFFLEQVQRLDEMEALENTLNLTYDKSTFIFLEEQGIAAVHPQNGSKPIDVVELMLRLQRLGKTLYPCGSHKREDFPGLLKELDIPVTELDVFDLEGPSKDDVVDYQQEVAEKQLDSVIFHSRRSVNRTFAAFPELDFENMRLITADKGITNQLEEKGYHADAEAEGSWESVAELV
jgi:uroporphyrinogen-III synthase